MQETRYGLQCAKGVPIKRDTEKFTSAFLEWKERVESIKRKFARLYKKEMGVEAFQ